MQVCTSLQTDNLPAPHHSVFLQAGCPSCYPTNSDKALKGHRTLLKWANGTDRQTVRCYHTIILTRSTYYVGSANDSWREWRLYINCFKKTLMKNTDAFKVQRPEDRNNKACMQPTCWLQLVINLFIIDEFNVIVRFSAGRQVTVDGIIAWLGDYKLVTFQRLHNCRKTIWI